MAQDLLRSKAGREMVHKDADGDLMVDYGQHLGKVWAGLSALNDEIEQIKGRAPKKARFSSRK